MPKGFRDMKRELEDRQQKQGQTNEMNLSPETLKAYAENKRKVDAGLLPKYIGGTAESPSNLDVEHQAERVLRFVSLLKDKKRR
jgi:hypothetical protein